MGPNCVPNLVKGSVIIFLAHIPIPTQIFLCPRESITQIKVLSVNLNVNWVGGKWFPGFHTAGECRLQTTGQKCNKICEKCQNCGISWPYLKPQWKLHSDKYKHAWYWFINSWNSCWNFRNVKRKSYEIE